jgi:hypothetical protein
MADAPDAPDALKKPAGVGLVEPFGPGARCMIPQCDLQRANAKNVGPNLDLETGSSGSGARSSLTKPTPTTLCAHAVCSTVKFGERDAFS